MILIIGIKSTISTSKIKKIIAIKKNWSENGIRALDFGSNPHSNGEFFSLSENDFFDSKFRIITIIVMIVILITVSKAIICIIYTITRFLDWKSNIFFILYKYLPHQ